MCTVHYFVCVSRISINSNKWLCKFAKFCLLSRVIAVKIRVLLDSSWDLISQHSLCYNLIMLLSDFSIIDLKKKIMCLVGSMFDPVMADAAFRDSIHDSHQEWYNRQWREFCSLTALANLTVRFLVCRVGLPLSFVFHYNHSLHHYFFKL